MGEKTGKSSWKNCRKLLKTTRNCIKLQKTYFDLIKSFHNKNIKLYIIGDGELKINQWMIDNLEFGFIELDSGVDDIIKILEKRKRTDKEKEAKKEHKKCTSTYGTGNEKSFTYTAKKEH